MSTPPLPFMPVYILSDKNNRFLLKLSEENNNFRIIMENVNKLPIEIYEFLSEKKSLPGIFSLYTINDIILKLTKELSRLYIIEEKKNIKLIFRGIVESENAIFELHKKEIQIDQKIKDLNNIIQNQKKRIDKLFGFQSIIIPENEKEKIIGWLNEKKDKILFLQLVYRRGDNYDISNFHRKCDSIGPNLIVCESINNEIFGGYSSISWENRLKNIVYDKSAFIFSLTKNKKYPNKSKYKSNRVDSKRGPDFFWDFTFNCGSMMTCRSFLLKDKEKHGIDTEESCYLDDEPLFGDGYHNCDVKEVEVFKVMKYVLAPINE